MMTSSCDAAARRFLDAFRYALYDFDEAALRAAIHDRFADDCIVHYTHPFETLESASELVDTIYLPLAKAIPDLERRDFLVMAGETNGQCWIGCGGYYTGVFEHPWLDIPPTGQQVALRFHEFYCIENEQIVEVQALWDIPELMHRANAWPLAPSLGLEWLVPGPATQDGMQTQPRDEAQSQASRTLVQDMLTGLSRFSSGGVEAMHLDTYWHPKMNWYGPAGIGTSRRVSGFRASHQIPFLNGMPDRRGSASSGFPGHLFADGNYVGFTAWPGMMATISGDGWLGIAPAGQKITMRSLDFWRCENGLIRENWVLVDMLHVYHQIGIDVFARMREFTSFRQ